MLKMYLGYPNHDLKIDKIKKLKIRKKMVDIVNIFMFQFSLQIYFFKLVIFIM